jgi:radical SAM superfamily enzyme YgiQ (UPF0313 family)
MFFTEASIDLADDRELMELMSQVNIRVVFVGVETPNEASLRETGKLQNLRKGGSIVEDPPHPGGGARGLEWPHPRVRS